MCACIPTSGLPELGLKAKGETQPAGGKGYPLQEVTRGIGTVQSERPGRYLRHPDGAHPPNYSGLTLGSETQNMSISIFREFEEGHL